MSLGDLDIGGSDLAALEEEPSSAKPSLFLKLISGEEPDIIFFVQAFHRSIGQAGPGLDDDGDIGSLAIGEESNEGAAGEPGGALFLSTADWCGAPDDFGSSGREADPRLLTPGSIEVRAPYLPELGRRALTQVATLEAINVDGFFDEFQWNETLSGQTIQIFMGEDGGKFSDAIELVRSRVKALVAGPEIATITLETAASRLDTPLFSARYTGAGGANGDPRLKDKAVPLAFGDCFNIEPDLENFGRQVYRCAAGRINAIKAVRDRGAASFIWDGVDLDNLGEFYAHETPAGYYTKATALGRFKLGNEPAGVVTADVEGSTLFGSYSAKTGDILAFLASRLSPEFVNVQSFGGLPEHAVGFYADGKTELQVSEVFDALLAPFNAFYGDQPDQRLGIGRIADADAPQRWTFDDDDLIADPQLDAFDEPPRWRQAVTYARNWRPMSESELVEPGPYLSAPLWQRLQRSEETATDDDAIVKLRYDNAIEGPPLRGYFVDAAGAQAAAAAIRRFLSRGLMKRKDRTTMQGVKALVGDRGRITGARLGFAQGRDVTMVRRLIDGDGRAVEFDVLAA